MEIIQDQGLISSFDIELNEAVGPVPEGGELPFLSAIGIDQVVIPHNVLPFKLISVPFSELSIEVIPGYNLTGVCFLEKGL